MFVLLCSFTKRKTGSVFTAFCHDTFHHALITCWNVSRAGYSLGQLFRPCWDSSALHTRRVNEQVAVNWYYGGIVSNTQLIII